MDPGWSFPIFLPIWGWIYLRLFLDFIVFYRSSKCKNMLRKKNLGCILDSTFREFQPQYSYEVYFFLKRECLFLLKLSRYSVSYIHTSLVSICKSWISLYSSCYYSVSLSPWFSCFHKKFLQRIRAIIMSFQTAQTDLSNYWEKKDKNLYEMSLFSDNYPVTIVAKMKPLN